MSAHIVQAGAIQLTGAIYFLPDFINEKKQVVLLRSMQQASTQMRFNPSLMQQEVAGWTTAVSQSKSAWKKATLADPKEMLVPKKTVLRHLVHPLVALNTWKDDDLQLPFEWIEVCNDATDLVETIIQPFYPASVESTLLEHVDSTRITSNRTTGWNILISIGCTVKLCIKHDPLPIQIELASGDALVFNMAPRWNVDIAFLSITRNTCPNLLLHEDPRLAHSRCNVIFSDTAHDAQRHHQSLLRRTFEVERNRLWRHQKDRHTITKSAS